MASVFISHSPLNKEIAKRVASVLESNGHRIWLDEWSIHVGESISERIEKGIERSDFLVVLLSQHAVESKWVDQEWRAAHWREVERGAVAVLPVLLEKCQMPTLLKSKRYANLSESFEKGMMDLVDAIEYFDKLRKDSNFYRAIPIVWSEDRALREEGRVARATRWDSFDVTVNSLPLEEQLKVQEQNTSHYLKKYGLTVPELRAALQELGVECGDTGDRVNSDIIRAILQFQVSRNLRHHDGVFGPLTYLRMAEVAQSTGT